MIRRLGSRSRPSLVIGWAGAERAAELTRWRLFSDGGESSVMSAFENEERRDWWLEGEAVQSTQTGSLWRLADENSGEHLPFLLAPWGNAEPTDDEPHYGGTVIVGPRPELGGDTGTKVFRFAFTWRIADEPTRTPPRGAPEAAPGA